jgi:UDPglucose 6-dehydrogenase
MNVNERQKRILVDKVIQTMGSDLHGKTFALWGLAFKADTDDIREAPSLDIIQALLDHGAIIQAYDPEAAENTKRLFPTQITYASSAADALKGADALLVVTEWKEFLSFEPEALAKALSAKTVFDGRNIFDPEIMTSAGLTYLSIGRGGK